MNVSASARGASTEAAPLALPPIRLRFVLLLGLLAWAIAAGYPRLRAAFRLHDNTVATANYALCMVGPTGPSLIRDRLVDFQRLVRRRLVASGRDERPFARCASLARSISGSVDVERLHGLAAADFREYGGREASVADLAVSAAPLSKLAAQAWPFVRGGYTQLIKPSLGAIEAAHVPAPARPGVGRGLPRASSRYRNVWRDGARYGVAFGSGSDTTLYTTSDRGLSFRPLPRRGSAFDLHAERCEAAGGRKVYRLAPDVDGRYQQALFSLDGATPIASQLAPIAERVLASSCDEHSLVALTADSRQLHLRLCPFAGRCGELPLPRAFAEASASAVDLAKVEGAIAISLAEEGVVRVISSRDEGRHFTPAVVAFDAAEYPELGLSRRPPARLLALGERLLLYAGGSQPGEVYPLLVSDDQGVSFRAP